jgi:hypothetical protein
MIQRQKHYFVTNNNQYKQTSGRDKLRGQKIWNLIKFSEGFISDRC